MDLAFTPAEQAFANDVRAWLAEHVEVPPRFETIAEEVEFGRAWQARLAEARWVGIHWPEPYGGRGSSPRESNHRAAPHLGTARFLNAKAKGNRPEV